MQHLTMEQWAEKIAANTLIGPETEHMLARRGLIAKQWHEKIQLAVLNGEIPYKDDYLKTYLPESFSKFFRPDGFIKVNDIADWMGDLEHLVLPDGRPMGTSNGHPTPKPMQYAPQPDMTPPDWPTWRRIPKPALWQAVALSLDLEPDKHQVSRHNSPDSCSTLPQEFQKRMRIAAANFEALGLTRDFSKPSHMLEVPMKIFSAWACSIEWILPDGFPRANAVLDDLRALEGKVNTSGTAVSGIEERVPEPAIEVVDASYRSTEIEKMKKAAFVSKYRSQWPSVEADIGNASRTELNKAQLGSGFYDVALAIKWARENGKINEESTGAGSANSIFNSPTSVKKTLN